MKSPNAKVPHQDLDHNPVHLTYRLAGSIPKSTLFKLRQLKARRHHDLDQSLRLTPELLPTRIYEQKQYEINARFEFEIDDALHQLKDGPFHLSDPRVAKLILDSWLFLQEEGKIFIYCLCVMGNHVHLILRSSNPDPKVDLAKIVNRHKAFTAIKANKILGTIGSPFWEHFYFDRTVRKGNFTRAMWYVLNNPVSANLTSDWRNWEWTYLHPDYESLFR